MIIFNFIYIEECFTIELTILCEKMREKSMSFFVELAIESTNSDLDIFNLDENHMLTISKMFYFLLFSY